MDRDILLHYRMIRQVNQCRRLIQQEFGVRIHLDHPDLTHQIQHYAEQSRSDQLKGIWKSMMEELAPEEPEAAQAASRVYRGQVVDSAPSGPAAAGGQSQQTRIYRGRVVNG